MANSLKIMAKTYFKKNIFFLFLPLAISYLPFAISGCATQPYIPARIEQSRMPGVYHKVEHKETLWRIAKFYNVGIDDIVKANKIPNAAQISVGQLLFIPNGNVARHIENIPSTGIFEKSDFIWPVRGKVIFFYGSKKEAVINKGIDILTKEGADIVASRAGKIIFYDPKFKGLGQTVIIDHLDGFSTLYAYNSIVLVREGDEVKQGQSIARGGSSGRVKTACLHFQIRKGDKTQNPFYYLPR